MSTQIIIDSAADIIPAECRRLGFIHMPLTVNFGSEEYRDAVDLTHREFYEKLIESDTLPTTSQVAVGAFADAFAAVTAKGDNALVITMSSELSGTYQSACLAANDFPGKVWVVDSRQASLGERILCLRAKEMLESGMDVEATVAALNAEKDDIRLLAVLDTLEYLKKGGRISAAAAFAGGLIGLKPVITLKDGKVELCGKARGSKNAQNLLRKMTTEVHGIDHTKPMCAAYSGLSDAMLVKYIEDNADVWQSEGHPLIRATVGCVIGTHVGPGVIAAAFYASKQ